MRLNRLFPILSILLVAQFASAAAHGSFGRTLKVSGTPDVDIQSGSGNITVRAGSGDTVEVRAHIKASESFFSGGLSAEERVRRIEADPPVKQSGNMITIGRIDDRQLRQNVSIDYDVTVPGGTRLNSQTGSGDQEILNVQGPLR